MTSGGQVDQAFGLGGVARQDGLGAAEPATVDKVGARVVGGSGLGFDGMVPGFRPWDPPKTSWLQYLTVSRLASDGGLKVYPARWFQLAAELAPTGNATYGQLQGWELVVGGPAPLRLASDEHGNHGN